MATRKPRLATYQAGITLHREQHDDAAEPAKTPLTVADVEAAIKEALTTRGFSDSTVRVMRTDI